MILYPSLPPFLLLFLPSFLPPSFFSLLKATRQILTWTAASLSVQGRPKGAEDAGS